MRSYGIWEYLLDRALLVRFGVRSRGWWRALRTVDRSPEDGIYLPWRDRVDSVPRQPARHRCPGRGGRVARQEVDGQGKGAHRRGVERPGGECVVQRGG